MSRFSSSQIESIQASGYRAALVVTGGGTGALHALVSHPGASRFVLEAQVPYSAEAMFDYLGDTPGQYCSVEAAQAMAARAYERALMFSIAAPARVPILGISCTAALQTTRERRGRDRAFACIKSREQVMERELEVPERSRAEQEEEVSLALLDMILEFVGENAV